MQIQIVDFVRREPGFFDCKLHRPGRVVTSRRNLYAVISITSRGIAPNFGVNLGPAANRALQILEDQYPGSLSKNEPVTISVEGPGGAGRVIIPLGGYRAHSAKSRHQAECDAGFDAASDYRIQVSPPNGVERIAHCIGGTGTAGG